ncbi:MAG: hypothetical protein E6Q94_06075 [Burkholderiaceae bacterium]|nr:MAG: hypothetical protein E6Q94_06075 [Burkholderiaceae bacterium]
MTITDTFCSTRQLLLAAVFGASALPQAQAAVCSVLFHGQSSYPSAQALVLDGVRVTSTNSLGALSTYLSGPSANLSQYDAIWLHWFNSIPTAADGTAVKAYLDSGRGVHFSTDYYGNNFTPYLAWMVDILNTKVAASAGGGAIAFGAAYSYASPWLYNAGAVDSLAIAPFALAPSPPATVSFDNGGALVGLSVGSNRLAYHGNLATGAGETSVAAFSQAEMATNTGRITFFGDTGNLGPVTQNSTQIKIVKNLQNFLLRPSGCQAALLADDDAGTVPSDVGGQAIDNVLTNDNMAPDGPPSQLVPTLGTVVTLEEVAGTNTSPAGFPITLDTSTGGINVPLGTPGGSYELQYRYCQISHPDNCATATARVTVQGPPPPPGPSNPVPVPALAPLSLLWLSILAAVVGWRRLRQ